MRKIRFPLHRNLFIEHLKEHQDVQLSISDPIYFEQAECGLKIRLKDTDLDCLKKKHWLSDIIIDAYLQILTYNSNLKIGSTTCFFGKALYNARLSEQILQWKSIKQFMDGEFDYFLIPHVTRAHWILFNVDCKSKKIYIYDSFGRKKTNVGNKLKSFIAAHCNEGSKYELVAGNIYRKQTNYYDCGVFLLAYAKAIANNEDPNAINQKYIASFRDEIYRELRQTVKIL